MLSRAEREKIEKENRSIKTKSAFFRFINRIFKSYMYLGIALFFGVTVLSTVYKTYRSQDPPINYQRYIHSNAQLEIVLASIIISFFISGVFSLWAEQKIKHYSVEKNVEIEINVDNKKPKRRLRKAG